MQISHSTCGGSIAYPTGRPMGGASQELTQIKEALARETEARASERAGRIRAERNLRESLLLTSASQSLHRADDLSSCDDLTLGLCKHALLSPAVASRVASAHRLPRCGDDTVPKWSLTTKAPLICSPVGTFFSSFSRRNGTPRQPHLVPMARGLVVLHQHIPGQALEGLSEFSHVWIIFVFHANTNLAHSAAKHRSEGIEHTTARAKVRVPRLNGERRGVFATRSPHRPVPIGLSLATIRAVDVKKGLVEVSGVDLVDGTPVIDLKPYLPFCDSPPSGTKAVFAPAWVLPEVSPPGKEPLSLLIVTWAPGAKEKLSDEWCQRGGSRFSLYDTFDELLLFIEQVLSRDIRSAHQRKQNIITKPGCTNPGCWEVILDGITICYDMYPGSKLVIAAT